MMYQQRARLQITLLSEWNDSQEFEIRQLQKFLNPLDVDFLHFFTSAKHNMPKSTSLLKNLANFIQNMELEFIYLIIRFELKITHGHEIMGSSAELRRVLKNQVSLIKQMLLLGIY